MGPIPGHKHMDVQTENYLEELTDKVPEVEEGTQTEAFMDRPPEPLFMPAKIGVDTGTQVDPVEKEVETDFLPWLHDSVQSETVLRNRAERLADALIEHAIMVRQSHALQTRMDTIAEFERRKQEELEQKRLAEEEAA